MADNVAFEEFVNLVLKNLEKNGFPEKSVSFPLEKMYESASSKGFSFNKVRDALQLKGIDSELSGDRVVFRKEAAESQDEGGFDMMKMAEAAQKMFENMPEEQRTQITQMIQNMNPEEMAKIKEQWESMPASEKARVMNETGKT